MSTKPEALQTPPEITRRRMLMRLGLAATAIYAAPTLLQLSEAKASSMSGGSYSRGSFSGGRSSASGQSSGAIQHQPRHLLRRRRRRRRKFLFWSFSR